MKICSKRWKIAVWVAAVMAVCTACGENRKSAVVTKEIQSKDTLAAQVEISEIDATRTEDAIQEEQTKVQAEEQEINGMIEEQSFEVSLENWGDVRFVSCSPSEGQEDVSFYLMKEGEIIYTFPEEFGENSSWRFEGINFVAFRDVNGDGRKDILISSNYITGVGVDAVIPFSHIKIYNQYRDGFQLNKLLGNELDERHQGDNITSAMDYIENYDFKDYYSRTEAISFSREIMEWVKSDDKEQLSRVVAYPVTAVVGGEKVQIEDEQEFLELYPTVFDEPFREKILSCNADDIESTYALFISNGELWFSPFEDGYKIFAINNGSL